MITPCTALSHGRPPSSPLTHPFPSVEVLPPMRQRKQRELHVPPVIRVPTHPCVSPPSHSRSSLPPVRANIAGTPAPHPPPRLLKDLALSVMPLSYIFFNLSSFTILADLKALLLKEETTSPDPSPHSGPLSLSAAQLLKSGPHAFPPRPGPPLTLRSPPSTERHAPRSRPWPPRLNPAGAPHLWIVPSRCSFCRCWKLPPCSSSSLPWILGNTPLLIMLRIPSQIPLLLSNARLVPSGCSGCLSPTLSTPGDAQIMPRLEASAQTFLACWTRMCSYLPAISFTSDASNPAHPK